MKQKFIYIVLFLILSNFAYGTKVKVEVEKLPGEIDAIDNLKELECIIKTNEYIDIQIIDLSGIYSSEKNLWKCPTFSRKLVPYLHCLN